LAVQLHKFVFVFDHIGVENNFSGVMQQSRGEGIIDQIAIIYFSNPFSTLQCYNPIFLDRTDHPAVRAFHSHGRFSSLTGNIKQVADKIKTGVLQTSLLL